MKIIICSHNASIYGAPKGALLTALLLTDNGHEVYLVLPEHGPLEDLSHLLGVKTEIIAIKTFGLRNSFRLHRPLSYWQVLQAIVSRLRFIVKFILFCYKIKPDLIHINTIENIYPGIASIFIKVPTIWHIREKRLNRIRYSIKEWLIKITATNVIFVSEAIRKNYKGLKEKGCVLYNFIDIPMFNSDKSDYLFTLGIVGKIHKDKGVVDFLNICRKLKDWDLEFDGLYIGEADPDIYQSLWNTISKLDLVKEIKFLGLIKDTDNIYYKINILVHPSHVDSLPRAVMEAMAYGIPVVASNVDGIPEMVVPGVTGFLFEPEDTIQAATYIKWLYDHPEECKKMGRAAQERAAVLFRKETHYERLMAIYNSALRIQ